MQVRPGRVPAPHGPVHVPLRVRWKPARRLLKKFRGCAPSGPGGMPSGSCAHVGAPGAGEGRISSCPRPRASRPVAQPHLGLRHAHGPKLVFAGLELEGEVLLGLARLVEHLHELLEVVLADALPHLGVPLLGEGLALLLRLGRLGLELFDEPLPFAHLLHHGRKLRLEVRGDRVRLLALLDGLRVRQGQAAAARGAGLLLLVGAAGLGHHLRELRVELHDDRLLLRELRAHRGDLRLEVGHVLRLGPRHKHRRFLAGDGLLLGGLRGPGGLRLEARDLLARGLEGLGARLRLGLEARQAHGEIARLRGAL
mmetsp:Transcript_3483/g.11626  ORF Transcript_3483/g.11626 Transcript_3483/m.11626 type:complete len:311 (+) Transcript_3483:511-1443(+)